jgi:uncharacterized membrane protein
MPGEERSWGVVVFSSLGAVIVGLGVILLFAYNWHAIPRFGKMAIVLGALSAVHVAGLWCRHKEGCHGIGEGLSLLGTMLFGAGIWLVAQMYHIDEHFPNAFIFWGSGALLLSWSFPSVAHGVLTALLFTVWGGLEAVCFHSPMHIAPFIVGGLLGALAFILRSRLLLAVIVPLFLVSISFVLVTDDLREWYVLATALNIAVALIAAGFLAQRSKGIPKAKGVFNAYGWAVFCFLVYLLTFQDIAMHMPNIGVFFVEQNIPHLGPVLWWTGALVVAVLLWILVFLDFHRGKLKLDAVNYMVPLALLTQVLPLGWIMQPLRAGSLRPEPGLSATQVMFSVLYHAIFLIVVGHLLWRGCRQADQKSVVCGTILMLVYTFSRYVDLFHSLWIRGVVFILAGGAVFTVSILFLRAKRLEGGAQ